jgi:TolB protein
LTINALTEDQLIPSRWCWLLILLPAAAVVAGLGCVGQERTSPPSAPTATNSPASRTAAAEFDRSRDLRLFGTDDAAQDIVFEGRAAIDIEQHTFPGEGADFDPDVDPAGKHLVFASTRHSRHSHLYTKAIGGAVITQITDEQADDSQPAFDPSGDRVAFTSNRSGQYDIWVIDANGKNPTQITNNAAPELHPSWSPDGRCLVYCRLTSNENRGELWVVDLENPGMKRFIGEGLFPDWSPKGDKIVYQKARERGSGWFSIWTLDFQNGEVLYPSEIVSSPSAAYICPTWSADGDQIAFAAVMGTKPPMSGGETHPPAIKGRSDILIVDTDGRGLQRMTDGHGESYSPAWAVDGRIFYTAKFNEGETIWSVKPFRPARPNEPSITTGNRRAAGVFETDAE